MSEEKNLENRKQKTDDRKPSDDSNKKSFFNKKDKKDELAEMEHRYKKALADYQNLLKRTAVEKQEFMKYANEQFLYEILPVYDNLKLAVAHSNGLPAQAGDENGAVIEGVKHVLSQFKMILDNFGVREIKTIGEKFDHNTMEAVDKKKTDDKDKDGTVEAEIMPGYVLGEKVIRAARVVVFEFSIPSTRD